MLEARLVRTSDGALVSVQVPKGAPVLPGQQDRAAFEIGWCYSVDGEVYHGDAYGRSFDGRASATDAAIEALRLEVADGLRDFGPAIVQIGVARPYEYRSDILSMGAEALIGRLQEQAGEQCGECSDDWLNTSAQEDRVLGSLLADAFDAWLSRFSHHRPWFFSVESTVDVTVQVNAPAGTQSASDEQVDQ
jgi:hypothetical protein